MGVATPSSRKTQLDIDIKHITMFHQDRIKVHGVMLWTDRHTDITNIVVTLAGAREPTRTNVSKSHVLKAITTSDISSRALMEPIARPVMEAPVHDEKIVYLRNYNTLNGIIFK